MTTEIVYRYLVSGMVSGTGSVNLLLIVLSEPSVLVEPIDIDEKDVCRVSRDVLRP